MFDDINKTVEEGRKRWDRIEALCEELRQKDPSNTRDLTVETLLLLVEHMRPMNPTQEQVDEAQKGIENLIKSFPFGK